MRVHWFIVLTACSCSCSSSSANAPQGYACMGGVDAGPNGGYEAFQVQGQCGGQLMGMTPAGQPCKQSSECAPTCCACTNGSSRSATVAACVGGVCASQNEACCTWVASLATGNSSDCK